MTALETQGLAAKRAARVLAVAGAAEKNAALEAIAQALCLHQDAILAENQKDLDAARAGGMKQSLLDRLALSPQRIAGIVEGVRQVAALPDPVGEVTRMTRRPNGLIIGKRRVPLGVIGIIYEARPNVTVDAAALCLKSGNAVILRGGKEAFRSNQAFVSVMRSALETAGLPGDCVALVEDTSRKSANELMGLTGYLDVLIPRGGAGLIRAVVQNAKVPVIETGVGVCHIYVDGEADLDMGAEILYNAKCSRPSVCNAAECLLVDRAVAADFLPSLEWNDLPGIPTAQVQDTALVDLINEVQMYYTGADVSLAALFDAASDLKQGDYKKKDAVNVYKYDNTLMAVKVTGAQLKAIMEEHAGNYFNQYVPGDVTISFNPDMRMYNYDMFAGVNYEIDISQPAGQRIVNVTYQGEPLADDQELVLALNNYRYGGLVTAGLLDPAGLVFDSTIDLADTPAVRDLISVYAQEKGELVPNCDNNWRIVGADLDDPDAQTIYQMVRDGIIAIPTSEDGRTPNVASLNANDLRAQGLLDQAA